MQLAARLALAAMALLAFAIPSASAEKLTFTLNWVAGGDHAPYFYAQKMGWYKQAGVDEDGKVVGSYMPTGVLPTFLEHLTTSGEELSEDVFQPIHVMDGVGSA